ncbi:MAG TPA: hypothetical protein VK796_00895 [Cytophaga sp.]|nr:hypothetical protein [Cytophaga sp.]
MIDLTTTHKSVLKIPAPFVLITAFDSYSINLQVFFWTSTPMSGKFIKSELIINIQTAFKNNNISIPFLAQDAYTKSISPEEGPQQ